MSIEQFIEQRFEVQRFPEKVQLQITFNHTLRQLKTFTTVKRYPYTAQDIAQTYEHTKIHSKFTQILAAITQLTEKQFRIASLFIILPFQIQDSHKEQLSVLFSKLIERYRSFLTTIMLRNVSPSVTPSLLSNNVKFLKHLHLAYCKVNPKQLASCQFKYLHEFSLNSSWFGNKELQELSKADWPQLRHLEFREEEVTADGLKCWQKFKFNLISLELNCEEEGIRSLVGLAAELIKVNKGIRLSNPLRKNGKSLSSSRHFCYINQIAKKQSIGESFQQQASQRQLRAVFRSKIVLQ